MILCFQAILECLLGYTPISCAYGIGNFLSSGGDSLETIILSGVNAVALCIHDATWSIASL
jgi:hypothetical protein